MEYMILTFVSSQEKLAISQYLIKRKPKSYFCMWMRPLLSLYGENAFADEMVIACFNSSRKLSFYVNVTA